jgi:hypothetical protein
VIMTTHMGAALRKRLLEEHTSKPTHTHYCVTTQLTMSAIKQVCRQET